MGENLDVPDSEISLITFGHFYSQTKPQQSHRKHGNKT